mgnify:CR=1 FL=1
MHEHIGLCTHWRSFAPIIGLHIASFCIKIKHKSAATNALGWSYANVYAPADKHCNVYDAAGGGMSWKTPPKELLDPAATSGTYYGAYMISNNSMLFNMGASNACPDGLDLVLFLGFITDEACTEINKRTGLNTLTTNSTPLWDGGRFRGTYGTPCGYGWNSGDRYSRTGCSRGDSNLPGKQNSFYQILIAR